MSDRESIQSGEEGEELESTTPEGSESQELNNATHEPEARVEDTQSFEAAEAVESTFVELMTPEDTQQILESSEKEGEEIKDSKAVAEAPSMPPEISEEEPDTLEHTLVGKGPVPTAPLYFQDSESQAVVEPGESLETSEVVIDVVAKVLGDMEFRERFFTDPDEALSDHDLTPDERKALEALNEEVVGEFSSEFENRDVGFAPPYVPVRPSPEEQVNVPQLLKAELTEEDIQRLLGHK